MKGRVLELSLADLNKDDEQAFRKIKLRVDEVQGKNCLTSFYGMDFTSDKLRSLVRKWQTLIEAHVDVRTTDGYLLRLFAIGFTKKRPNQVKKTTYAQTAQIKQIRQKMFEIMTRESTSCDLKQLVQVGLFEPASAADWHRARAPGLCNAVLDLCMPFEQDLSLTTTSFPPDTETHPRGHGQGNRKGLARHLPPSKRLHPQGQDLEVATLRHWQAPRVPRRDRDRQGQDRWCLRLQGAHPSRRGLSA